MSPEGCMQVSTLARALQDMNLQVGEPQVGYGYERGLRMPTIATLSSGLSCSIADIPSMLATLFFSFQQTTYSLCLALP